MIIGTVNKKNIMNRYSLTMGNKYTFKSLKGRFWITFPGDHKDYIIECGQHLEIENKSGVMLVTELEGSDNQFLFEKLEDKKSTRQFVKLWRALF